MISAILALNNCTPEKISIRLGFSPKEEVSGIVLKPLIQKDDTTFLLAGKENVFQENKLRFPILSHN